MYLKLSIILIALSIYQIETAKIIKNDKEIIVNLKKNEINSIPEPKIIPRNPRIRLPLYKNVQENSPESKMKICKLWCDYNWYADDYNDTKKCFEACCKDRKLNYNSTNPKSDEEKKKNRLMI